MKTHVMVKRAMAAALLSATIATPAVATLTAATASAKPREINCVAVAQTRDSHYYVAGQAFDQGDYKAGDDHIKTARIAEATYNRYCLS